MMPPWDAATCEDYEERAAIMQFCGGMSKAQAELEARALVERRLNPPAPEQMTLAGIDPDAARFFEMERMFRGW